MDINLLAAPDDLLNKLCELNNHSHSIPKSHRKIIQYVMEHLDAIPNLTITKLAKASGVDVACITRFCQSLGFSGYPEFRFSIEHQCMTPFFDSESILNGKETTAKLLNGFASLFQHVIVETIKLLDDKKIEHAANCILQASTVHVYGSGGSSVSAQYAQSLFLQIGIPCYYFSDISYALSAASLLKKGDVAIGITSSGNTSCVVKTFELLKQQKITTIGICGFSSSPAMRLSSIPISYYSRIKDDIRFMHMARMCEVAIIGILQMVILNKSEGGIKEKLSASRQAVLKGREV